jgi:N-acetylglucosaminyl-diphospho-decaprenol L-rhamnosyltransferase
MSATGDARTSEAARARAGDRLTGVIVTYKSSRTLGAALASAKRCWEAAAFHLVVVDNATPSSDPTREILARDATFAQVILGEANIGFGRGCNVGLAATTTEYVVFFNPDAQMEPEAVRTIIEFMDAHPKCAIAGPAIIHGEDDPAHQHVQAVGALATPADLMGDAMGLHRSMRKRQAVTLGGAPFRTEWVSGAMLVGRVSVLKQLGGFDPRFFLYWEETDLCRRVLDAGHEIWAIPGAVVRHIGGTSAAEEAKDTKDRFKGCIAKHFFESRHYYLAKHHGRLAAMMTDVVELVATPLVQGLRKVLGRAARPVWQRWGYPVGRMPREGTGH